MSRQMMPCRICGEPMTVSDDRYLRCIKYGILPTCRRNGCEQLCGRDIMEIARESEVVIATRLPGTVVVVTPSPSGKDGMPLATSTVRRCVSRD